MANRYAVATGNWSSASTWDGTTTLPTTGDTVRPNTFTVTIDQDITVTELRNDASSPAAAGGGFVLNPTRTINANITNANSTALVTFSSDSPNSAAINGSITSGTGSAVVLSGTGTLTITGNVITGGSSGDGITTSAAGILNVIGNLTGGPQGGGQNRSAVQVSSGATINVTGNVNGSTTASFNRGCGITISNANAVVNITGNVTGGANGVGLNHGINMGASATISINGNVTGGGFVSPSMCNGINVASGYTGTITITGTITGGNSQAIFSNNPNTKIIHTGDLSASSSGVLPIASGVYLIHSSNNLTHTLRTNNSGNPGATRSLYTGNLGQPVQADVRYATIFGASNEYTGSLRVPSVSYVSQGVLVDNTIGSLVPAAASDIADAVWNELRSEHTTNGSFGNTSEYTSVVSDVYYARINFLRDAANSQDEYTVTWFKNGIRITSNITSPTIQVIKRSNGTDLVSSTTMTQVGGTGIYKYDESTNRATLGEACIVVASATIDAGTRSYSEVVGRDF